MVFFKNLKFIGLLLAVILGVSFGFSEDLLPPPTDDGMGGGNLVSQNENLDLITLEESIETEKMELEKANESELVDISGETSNVDTSSTVDEHQIVVDNQKNDEFKNSHIEKITFESSKTQSAKILGFLILISVVLIAVLAVGYMSKK